MGMIIHDIKVAVRNIMKYKLQTLISVVSMAIGIVTLAFTHSILENIKLPPIAGESYYERAYMMQIQKPDGNGYYDFMNLDMIKALKRDGGPKNAEKIVFRSDLNMALSVEFHLQDSTVREGFVSGFSLDPEYPEYAGLRSAVTGKKIKKLKTGEAIISEEFANKIFNGKNPIGAVQTHTDPGQPIPLTIVDVYKSLPITISRQMNNDAFYFSMCDRIEDNPEIDYEFASSAAELILKEGGSPEQLKKELEMRLQPWGSKVKLQKSSEAYNLGPIFAIRLIGYLFGVLILVAAIIGYLRMQIQLVLLRSREISLRIVNGASSKSLFNLLVIEIAISLTIAVAIAVVLGSLLEDFVAKALSVFLQDSGVIVNNLWPFSIVIGGCLLVLCCLIVSIILYRVYKSRRGLNVYLQSDRNHLFRNVMLGVQIAICFVFVCSSMILINAGDKMKNSYIIPKNDEYLRDILWLRFTMENHQDKLYPAIKSLPNLDKMVEESGRTFMIKEFSDNPEALEKFGNHNYFQAYCSNDTTMLDVLGIEVDWIDKKALPEEYMLVQKGLYDKLTEFGISNNTLTLQGYGITFPIAGTFNRIPYEADENMLIAISPMGIAGTSYSWMLIPKPGRAKALERSVNETIERIAPETINKLVINYREKTNPVPGMVETAVKGGWILGCVSLIICIMGIFSTITLDTRARRKEVAIRKVNGAKSLDIYRMFGRVYGWLILASLVLAVPVSVLFGEMLRTMMVEIDPAVAASFSPVWPIVLGCLVVIVLIVLIVGMQIRRVMRVDPSRLIAKE